MNRIFVPTAGTTLLREQARMNEETWASLLQLVTLDLQKPMNKILTEGFQVHGQLWEDHLDDYLGSGIAELFWGRGTHEIWSLGKSDDEPDRAMIRMFVKQVVQYAILRISSACEKHQFIDSSDIATGSLVEAGDSRALSARNKPRNTPGNTPGKRSRQPSATDPTESSAALKRQAISAPVASEPKLSPSDTSRRKSLRIEISAKQASKVVPDIVSPSLAPPSRATSKATLATPKTGAIHLADTTIEELPPILFEPSLQEPSGTTPEAVADGGGFGGSIVLKRDQTAGSINSSQLAKVSPISVPASHTPKPPEKSPVRARNMVDQATNGAGSKRATVEDITQATSQTPAVVPNPGIHRQELNNLQSERPALTLQTSIISDGASINRFMHVPGGFTLTNFLHLLSLKHRLNPTEMQRLALISVQMQEATLSIDLRDSDRDWDWEAWMELFGGKGGLVPVLVKMD